jgi:hypothetical protein
MWLQFLIRMAPVPKRRLTWSFLKRLTQYGAISHFPHPHLQLTEIVQNKILKNSSHN